MNTRNQQTFLVVVGILILAFGFRAAEAEQGIVDVHSINCHVTCPPESNLTSDRIAHYKAEAEKHLEKARTIFGDNVHEIMFVRIYLDKAGLQPEDIGTTKEKLQALTRIE
jgi:hypothetical protein